ncbi:hypothetical protein CO676_02475 [Sinorhizobium sp. BJ1]|nr:hypothetical protein CO676_02475 [Sinorhizobium sp. BJ1]
METDLHLPIAFGEQGRRSGAPDTPIDDQHFTSGFASPRRSVVTCDFYLIGFLAETAGIDRDIRHGWICDR